jgi:desulfoferrodoxin (superoxide reductase-like protein)
MDVFSSQPTNNTFAYLYTIDTKIGDKLTVTAYCNIAGFIEKSLVVTGDNKPPDSPIITGPNNGKVGTSYEFIFNSTDPDGDDIAEYRVVWGDGNSDTTIFAPSGTNVNVSHTWTTEGYIRYVEQYYQEYPVDRISHTIKRRKQLV